MLLTTWRPPPTIEHPRSVNNFGGGSTCYTAINCNVLFLNGVLNSQFCQNVLIYNFTNMHAMCHRSGFFACSSTVNIEEPAFCFRITLLLAVSQVGISDFPITAIMLNSNSLNTSLLEVMMSSNNRHVCISNLSDHTLHIIHDVW
jgi:hypothetical protein